MGTRRVLGYAKDAILESFGGIPLAPLFVRLNQCENEALEVGARATAMAPKDYHSRLIPKGGLLAHLFVFLEVGIVLVMLAHRRVSHSFFTFYCRHIRQRGNG